MFDLIVRHVNLPDGTTDVDLAVLGQRIAAVGPRLPASAREEIDGEGQLLSPPFVDAHFHLDSTLTLGQPRRNASGTLLEGIALWGELKPLLQREAIAERARAYCRMAIANGLFAIRSHVDVCDPTLRAVDALLEVRAEMAPFLDLQLVAFPQDGYLRDPRAAAALVEALNRGVDVVGGIPHFERSAEEGRAATAALVALAAERGLRVDMHCDETDDPHSRHVETLALEALRHGMQGRVTGSHLTSMHSMDNNYVAKLIPLMAEAGLHVVANPLINITLQGRFDSYPKRRGMTRAPELLAGGVNVAFGQDCVMDPWYALGSADMLDVAHMGLHVAQMTSEAGMRDCFAAVTERAAAVLGLEGYGLSPGCYADFVLLQCADPIEAIRLRPTRLLGVRRGQVVLRCAPRRPALSLGGPPRP